MNTETRKLIKRSSRAGDLKERFKVEEMSSISTLEITWEDESLAGMACTTKQISQSSCSTNKLESLKGYERRKV